MPKGKASDMAKIRDVAVYLCTKYPHKGELSKARLTKMVYLADWRSAIVHGHQITAIDWFYNYYGPFVDDVMESVRTDPAFSVTQTTNFFGGQKELVSLNTTEASWPSLTSKDISILDHVIDETSSLYWNDFIKLVYSTYPIITQERLARLNLVELAQEYSRNDSPSSAI